MSDLLSASIAGASRGASIYFKTSRYIAYFKPSLVIEESIEDSSELTSHPIETGSTITDHVIRKPITATMDVYFDYDILSGTSPSEIYDELIQLKESNEPFTVVFGKRTLNNMLFTSIKNTTNRDSEFALALSLSFQEVTRVELQTVSISDSSVKQGGKKQAQGVSNAAKKQGAEDAAKKNSSGLYDLIYG